MTTVNASEIPPFVDEYHLPPGIHVCTLSDFQERFGKSSKRRRVIWSGFSKLLDELRKHEMEPSSVVLDGSYVTGRHNPGDLDCVFIIDPEKIRSALKVQGPSAEKLVQMISDPRMQQYCEARFGVHPFLAPHEHFSAGLTNLFRFGKLGTGLRGPDPKKDPKWVTKPYEKGILKILINDCEEGE